MADNTTQQTVDGLISFIETATEPESVTNSIVARVLAHLNSLAPSGLSFEPAETWGTLQLKCNGKTLSVAIPGMIDGAAGLYTPTRHASVLAAITAAASEALANAKAYTDKAAVSAAVSASASSVVNLEIEPMDKFCRIWATTAGGQRRNIAQITAMSDDKAGLFTPTRLASILATVDTKISTAVSSVDTKISTAVNTVDSRVKAIEDLIRGDADMTVNKLSEVVSFLEGVSDQTTLLGMFEDVATKIDNVEDRAINNTDEIASRWQAPTFVTLDSAVSGVTVESSGYNGKPSAFVYNKTSGRILAKVMPAIVGPTSVPKYYEIWPDMETADIRNREKGIGYIPAGSSYLLPYPGRMYVIGDDTGLWVTGSDGKLRKIADICDCTASKDKN